MVLGVTSVSVFLQLYIDQCSLLLKHILNVAMSASFFFPFWRAFKTFPVQEHQWNNYTQAAANRTVLKMVSIGLQVKAVLFWSWFFVLLTFLAATSYGSSCLPTFILRRFFSIAISNVFFCTIIQGNGTFREGPGGRMTRPVDENCIDWLELPLAKAT